MWSICSCFFFFFQADDGIRDGHVTGVQTCALPISSGAAVAISVHVGFSGALVFAATPLISKALWGLLITIRKQETQRRAERAAAEAEEKAAQEAKEAEETAELSDEIGRAHV